MTAKVIRLDSIADPRAVALWRRRRELYQRRVEIEDYCQEAGTLLGEIILELGDISGELATIYRHSPCCTEWRPEGG